MDGESEFGGDFLAWLTAEELFEDEAAARWKPGWADDEMGGLDLVEPRNLGEENVGDPDFSGGEGWGVGLPIKRDDAGGVAGNGTDGNEDGADIGGAPQRAGSGVQEALVVNELLVEAAELSADIGYRPGKLTAQAVVFRVLDGFKGECDALGVDAA